MARTGQPAVRHVAAVQRAVRVLDALAEGGGELGTNEIARLTSITPSTVSRLLATLVDAGIVEHLPASGRYRLGLRLVSLSRAALHGRDLRDLARPHLVALSERSGETATLSVPGGREAMTIDFVQSPSSVRSVASIGRPSVGHATAVGKVMLAFTGASAQPPLEGFTPRTITDLDALTDQLDAVRRRGWADALGEREEDLNGLAVPILTATGELAGILGLQGPATRFGRRPMRRMLEPMRERAELVSPS